MTCKLKNESNGEQGTGGVLEEDDGEKRREVGKTNTRGSSAGSVSRALGGLVPLEYWLAGQLSPAIFPISGKW